jgi:two-component system, chemotaxis family, protein-glutamate methylesterase/glutaminase
MTPPPPPFPSTSKPPAVPSSAQRASAAGGGQVRVLVVDDSSFMRKAISEMIASDPALTVVGTAKNGQEAIDLAKSLSPDVVTLDIEMPVMSGLDALRRIRRECRRPASEPGGGMPPAVLMCSSLTTDGSHESLQSMRYGAADVIAKDASTYSANIKQMREELIEKIKAIVQTARAKSEMLRRPQPGATALTAGGDDAAPSLLGHKFELIVLGSSTGGPPVLETIFGQLPASLPCPLVVAQHMPLMFTRSMSQRLDSQSPVSVVHGEDAMPLLPGTAYIIPGGSHGRIRRSPAGRLQLEVASEPASALYKPSVNELFASAAKTTGKRTLGIMLTGMGDDGRLGSRDMKAAGSLILAQNAETCVVYGMPKAVIDEKLATPLTPLQICRSLKTLAPGGGGLNHAA